jgi:signal transduction histidine kinase
MNAMGYVLFFITTAIAVTGAFVAFIVAQDKGNTAIAIAILCSIIVIATFFTAVDIIRRKIMIDKPVKEILSATKKIAEGDFSVRILPKHSYDKYNEYDMIKENLNAMAMELEKNEVLKTDFISNVSHEIKTPVSIIKSYASLLEKETDIEKRAEYRHQIALASNRLSELVTNILQLNKLENQALKIEYKPIRLDDMLADSIINFEKIIEEKNIELECDFEEVIVSSSKSHLDIVWNNLISNAVKFTPHGGKIYVSVNWIDGDAVVSVKDTGCGIDKETGKRIFDKFYQGDTSHAGEGNGLGLALVKKVIDLLGGEISVVSELGKGSTFTVKVK